MTGAGTHGEEGQRRRLEELKRRPRYEFSPGACFYCFAKVVYHRVLEHASLETSKLCHVFESVAGSWRDRSVIVGETGERSVFIVQKKERDLHCSLQLALEMGTCKPSTLQGNRRIIICMLGTRKVKMRWESIRIAGEKEEVRGAGEKIHVPKEADEAGAE